MHQLRRNFCQRYKHESTFSNMRVRYGQFLGLNNTVSVEKYVYINNPWGGAEAGLPPQVTFYSFHKAEKLQKVKHCDSLYHRIEKHRLLCVAHGLSLIHRRYLLNC